jgi:hypothetical protein
MPCGELRIEVRRVRRCEGHPPIGAWGLTEELTSLRATPARRRSRQGLDRVQEDHRGYDASEQAKDALALGKLIADHSARSSWWPASSGSIRSRAARPPPGGGGRLRTQDRRAAEAVGAEAEAVPGSSAALVRSAPCRWSSPPRQPRRSGAARTPTLSRVAGSDDSELGRRTAFSTIVCAVDGRDAGTEAARQAAILAQPDAGLLLVAVVDDDGGKRSGRWRRRRTLPPSAR